MDHDTLVTCNGAEYGPSGKSSSYLARSVLRSNSMPSSCSGMIDQSEADVDLSCSSHAPGSKLNHRKMSQNGYESTSCSGTTAPGALPSKLFVRREPITRLTSLQSEHESIKKSSSTLDEPTSLKQTHC